MCVFICLCVCGCVAVFVCVCVCVGGERVDIRQVTVMCSTFTQGYDYGSHGCDASV